MIDTIKSPGEELYEESRELAPRFNVELKLWSELTRAERQEWEVLADDRVRQDA